MTSAFLTLTTGKAVDVDIIVVDIVSNTRVVLLAGINHIVSPLLQ